MDELERLRELREKGLLTGEQFENERRKIVPSAIKPEEEPDRQNTSPRYSTKKITGSLIIIAVLVVGVIIGTRNTGNDEKSPQQQYVSPTSTPIPRASSNSPNALASPIEKLVNCSNTGHSYIQQWNSITQDFVDDFMIWEQDYSSVADLVFMGRTSDTIGRLNTVITNLTGLKNSSDCNELRDVLSDMITQRKQKLSGVSDIRSGILNQNWALYDQGTETIQRAGVREISIVCDDWLPIIERYSSGFDASDRMTLVALKAYC